MSDVRTLRTEALGSRELGLSGATWIGVSPIEGLQNGSGPSAAGLQVQSALEQIMARVRTGGASKADEDTFGIVLLTVPAADPASPKAVGDNDPRVQDTGVTAGTYARATVRVGADGRIISISEGAAGAVADASPSQKGAVLLSEAATDPGSPAVLVQNSPILARHIEGLKITRAGPGAVSVGRGSAWIPSLRRVVDVAAPLNLPGMTLAASTWYYLYLHADGGTAGIEYSTEAPVFPAPLAHPMRGGAKVKGPATAPDYSRRYFGEIKGSATANVMMRFSEVGDSVYWLENTGLAPFRVVGGSGATTPQTVSAAAVVPPTSRLMRARLVATGSAAWGVTNPDTPHSFFPVAAPGDFHAGVPLNASQQFGFDYISGSGVLYVDVLGYERER